MAYIKRDLEAEILEISKEYSCILVTGPRQVGKTTMLRHIMTPERKYITLDDLDERRLARTDPALFIVQHPAPVLIDEVQYAPELFSYIKIAVDNGAAPGSFWMTGSQSFRLMDLAQESLAGRMALIYMSSLSQHEIYGTGENEPFVLEWDALKRRSAAYAPADIGGIYERIWKGSMPGLVSGQHTKRDLFYSSYLHTYIERDVSDMVERVDKLMFQDIIRAAACRAGQMLNVHDIAADVGVSNDTARRWLAVLEKSNVIFYLRPYSENLLKRTVKTPKMYFFDTGLVAYLTRYPSPEILAGGAINGAILENYVVAEILKSYSNAAEECQMWYYRDSNAKEIDILTELGGELHPMEIKRSISPSDKLLNAFKVLDKGRLPRGRGAVICMKPELAIADAANFIVPVWML